MSSSPVSTGPAQVPTSSSRAVSPTLVLITMATGVLLLAMVQTLVIPVLPQIGVDLGVSSTTAGWVTTATMLTASAITPLFGRIGDVYGHKPVIVIALVLTLIGSVLAAVTHSIAPLIIARVLQGASFGLFPLAISVLRQEMPRERLTGAMAVAASSLGFGSGLALVATGLLTKGDADYRRIFWLLVVLTALVLILAVVSLPRRAGLGGRVDYVGAFVLAVGLVALLLPISQGHEWGWGSGRVIGLFVAAVVVLVGFVALQARTAEPLVATSLLTRRPVLATNLASLFVGFAMFTVFVGATYLVETPKELAGFGFSASVLRTSVEFMLPGAIVSVLMGPLAGRLVGRIGPRWVLVNASAVGAVGMLGLILLHDTAAQVICTLIVGNAAIAAAYASMPALLVSNVEAHETGVANSVNSIMRTVGGSIGSAVIVTILASDVVHHATPAGTVTLPAESAYVVAFVLGLVAFIAAGLMAAFGIGSGGRALTAEEVREDEALGAAGEFASVSSDL
ncbi:MFS transporter [Nocardioides sp.]|uniref:MFS transporter n=1 Tax=Nocardioides sp. TaxID=35761 RepID=UPI0026018CEA|nr:MFS transporter [Nocardioides sp.]